MKRGLSMAVTIQILTVEPPSNASATPTGLLSADSGAGGVTIPRLSRSEGMRASPQLEASLRRGVPLRPPSRGDNERLRRRDIDGRPAEAAER